MVKKQGILNLLTVIFWVSVLLVSVIDVQAQVISIEGQTLQVVAWQPIENGLIAVSNTKTENIWIYDSLLEPVTTLSTEVGYYPYVIQWSPDGTRLAVNGFSGGRSKIFLWQKDLSDTFVSLPTIDLTNRATGIPIAWSSDNNRLTVISDLRAEVWDTSTNTFIQRLATPEGVEETGNATDIAWSPDGTKIAVATDGFFAHIVDANNYQLLASVNVTDIDIDAVAWSPDSTQFVAAQNDLIKVFDAVTYEQITVLDTGDSLTPLLAWQGNYLAIAGAQPDILIWDTTQWQLAKTITTDDLAVLSISWKPNTTILAYGGYTSGTITIVETFNPPILTAPDTPGVYMVSEGQWYLRYSNSTGSPNNTFTYSGVASDIPVKGDWDGDGKDTIGVFREGTFFLRNSNNDGVADIVATFGIAGDIPIVGDWNGDGVDTIGVYRPSEGLWFLRNSNNSGLADMTFSYGLGNEIPVVGDWNGDGVDTVGLFRESDLTWYLRNANTPGFADEVVTFGSASEQPVVGDWDGDCQDTIGVYRSSDAMWLLKNTFEPGAADLEFSYGPVGAVALAGDWKERPPIITATSSPTECSTP